MEPTTPDAYTNSLYECLGYAKIRALQCHPVPEPW